ncbi:ribonuclease R [Nitrosovibrio sp. Nv17]|uniref:ribonuclease R n=1 Tax=Nitrosovibrio sp. Nv17 TaxID=1855339 RepID=UPI000908CE46|nr:ribonuclease R [Nitrosovibrio sp. Nv17]SFW32134.1 RNAse R [Nitrosovibrio sp. Nv17]
MSIKKKRGVRKLDPHFEREKQRYGHALPSREFILQILEEQGVPVNEQALQDLLGIVEAENEIFSRRIAAMLREGQIMRNRKGDICVVEKLDLIKGRIQGHADGFGFLVPDDGGPDLFLTEKEMHKALHGDRAMVRETGVDRRGRREGVVVEVLEHAVTQLVGRLHVDHGVLFVEAENRRISQDILIPREQSLDAGDGQVVMVEIIRQPSKHAQPIGRIIDVLGDYTAPGMEIEIALRKHDLPHIFPPEVEKLSARFSEEVQETDPAGRTDARHLPLVTIDGETAKDFDDAVHCEQVGKDFRLYVAIADVSHYVRPGDAIDAEARHRGNSVYFPRRVIPMLPEVLSNGLCSLNPQVDRLCVICEVDIKADGGFGGYRFYPAIMNSRARLTYTEVADMIEHPRGEAARRHRALLPHLRLLYRLFKILLKARGKRGAIDFETIETQMVFNAQGKIERILPVERNDAHRLIEECMLAANVCASDFLQKHGQATLYRIHEGPTPEKLAALRDFLKEFGVPLGGGEAPSAKDYAKALTRIKGRPDAQLLQTVMLRSLRQAVYSPDNVGHFGLAYESYSHFTSPIRRYPDLLVHRAIKAVLNGAAYAPGDWRELGLHCSQTERRADDATRDVEAWLKCYYMQDRIGECFDGVISGVTGFGLFVALDGIHVEGLVHISELPSDYFHFDAAKHMLLGERSGKRYRLGDRIRVRLVRADLESSKIDFVVAEGGRGRGAR